MILTSSDLKKAYVLLPENRNMTNKEMITPIEQFFGLPYYQNYQRLDNRCRSISLSTQNTQGIVGSYAGKQSMNIINHKKKGGRGVYVIAWELLQGCSREGEFKIPGEHYYEPLPLHRGQKAQI